MSEMDKQKSRATARAGLLLERSVELRRFRHAYPGAKARFEEIAAHAPDELSEAVSHVIELLSGPETPDATAVSQFFDLTAAESRLAGWLMAGGNLTSYAREIGLSRNTARNQLQSVFQKVQVNRQAELVKIMLETARKLKT